MAVGYIEILHIKHMGEEFYYSVDVCGRRNQGRQLINRLKFCFNNELMIIRNELSPGTDCISSV